MAAGVDTLLDDAVAGSLDRYLYLSGARNAAHWAAAGGVDLTAIPVRTGGGGYGCLVSPRHLACAAHVGTPGIGASVTFHTAGGSPVTRTVQSASTISGTDVRLCLLSSAVGAGINPAKLFPASAAAKYDPAAVPAPVFAALQGGDTSVLDLSSLAGTPPQSYAAWGTPSSYYRSRWSVPPGVGDSGYPVAAVVGTSLVLVGTFFTISLAPSLCANAAAVAAAVSADGESVSFLDVSSYPDV